MIKFSRKIWFFVFFTALLLLLIFYFKAGYAELFNASLTSKIDELPITEINTSSDLELKPDKSQGYFDPLRQSSSEASGPATILPPARNAVSIAAAGGKASLGGEEMQEQLDDIAEKIDILKQEVAKLIPPLPEPLAVDLKPEDNKVKQEEIEASPLKDSLQDKTEQTSFFIGGGLGGGKPVYPKILISEILWVGGGVVKRTSL